MKLFGKEPKRRQKDIEKRVTQARITVDVATEEIVESAKKASKEAENLVNLLKRNGITFRLKIAMGGSKHGH